MDGRKKGKGGEKLKSDEFRVSYENPKLKNGWQGRDVINLITRVIRT